MDLFITTDEVKTRIWYYTFYATNITTNFDNENNHNNKEIECNENNTTTTTTIRNELDNNNNNNNNEDDDNNNVHYWIEDHWTDEDIEYAEKILQESLARCQIINSNNSNNNNNNKIDESIQWDKFYNTHQANFFKDRHYLSTTFPNEFSNNNNNKSDHNNIDDENNNNNNILPEERCLVEIGCGVGNAMLPLLELHERNVGINWTVYGLDLSTVAINILKNDVRFINNKHRAFVDVCDISQPLSIPKNFQSVATVTSLLFCLSAIDPTKHVIAIENAISTLQPNTGVLVLRDYGIYDEAQIKLGKQRHKLLSNNFYQKNDGTKCFYFTIEYLIELFEKHTNNNMEVLDCYYIRRKVKNRLTGEIRRRVWVQGRFRKKEKVFKKSFK